MMPGPILRGKREKFGKETYSEWSGVSRGGKRAEAMSRKKKKRENGRRRGRVCREKTDACIVLPVGEGRGKLGGFP